MYYCGQKRDHDGLPVKKRLVINCEEDAKTVLQEVHDKGAHQGVHRTQDKINQQYYWLTVTYDVQKWVSLI